MIYWSKMNFFKDLSKEYSLFLSIIVFIVVSSFEHMLISSNLGNILGLSILFGVIIYLAMSVAHHAEVLAEKFGEPYGTLILTMSAVLVEIVIIVIMMTHAHNPNLARDTIYSAIMLDINGLLGMSAIIGGLKYGEQPYNVDSSNSYLSMLLVAIGIAMVLPEFLEPKYHHRFMMFNVVVFIILYAIFTRVQLLSHRYFFEYKEEICIDGKCVDKHKISATYHSVLLVVSIVAIGVLSELLSIFMNHTLEQFELPLAIGAVIVAIISAAPELITAIRAALDNRMQTVINIALGASLATVLLTIPAVIVVSYFTNMDLELSLSPIQTMMIVLTLLVGMVNFNDGETNVLEGFLHFILFIVFCFLIFV